MSRQTIATGKTIQIPADVAVCPYCGAALVAQPTAWSERADKTWRVDESGIECTAEPELPNSTKGRRNRLALEKWDEWFANHRAMPYVYWIPVDRKVTAWLNANFDFDLAADKPAPTSIDWPEEMRTRAGLAADAIADGEILRD